MFILRQSNILQSFIVPDIVRNLEIIDVHLHLLAFITHLSPVVFSTLDQISFEFLEAILNIGVKLMHFLHPFIPVKFPHKLLTKEMLQITNLQNIP